MDISSETISQKLQSNRDEIISSINPSELYPYLVKDELFSLEDIQTIHESQLSRREEAEAILSLVEKKGERSYQMYVQFLYTVKSTSQHLGHVYVASLLEGTDFASTTELNASASIKSRLKSKLPCVIDGINTDALVPFLRREQLLTDEETETLESQTKSTRDKALTLFTLLETKGPTAYYKFASCLKEEKDHCHHELLQDLLQPSSDSDEDDSDIDHDDQGYLHGVDAIGDTTIIVTNEAQTWADYGLKLHISPASLPAGVEQSSIKVKTSLAGQSKFPENTTPVSAVYSLYSPVKFSKPIAVEIQHCATPSDHPSLRFVRASREELPNHFTILEGGKFFPNSSNALIHLNQFSRLAIIIQQLLSLLASAFQRRYYAQVYYTRQAMNTWVADFVITWNLEAYITAVTGKYNTAIAGPKLGVTFESEEITLQVPRDGFTAPFEWIITPLAYPGVAKCDVDNFRCGQLLPSCQLRIKYTGMGRSQDCICEVGLVGAQEPHNFFCIALECEPILEAEATRVVQETHEALDSTVLKKRKLSQDVDQPLSEATGMVQETCEALEKKRKLNQDVDQPLTEATRMVHEMCEGDHEGLEFTTLNQKADAQLREDELVDVMGYLHTLEKTQLSHLGMVLGLSRHRVRGMKDSDSFLEDMASSWLQQADNVATRSGVPTWRSLIKALRHQLLGLNGIANQITKDKSLYPE